MVGAPVTLNHRVRVGLEGWGAFRNAHKQRKVGVEHLA